MGEGAVRADRYVQLVMLVRHLLALDDHGSYADGFDTDAPTFAYVWIRAKLRHAVRHGVLDDETHPPPQLLRSRF